MKTRFQFKVSAYIWTQDRRVTMKVLAYTKKQALFFYTKEFNAWHKLRDISITQEADKSDGPLQLSLF